MTNAIAPGFFPSKMASGLINLTGGKENLALKNPSKRMYDIYLTALGLGAVSRAASVCYSRDSSQASEPSSSFQEFTVLTQ